MSNFRFNILVAARYLFSKHKHNTINLITWVSIIGVAVGSMAIIIVLSVLNGFEKMIENSFCAFDPELKIIPANGKSIDSTDKLLTQAKADNLCAVWSEVIEQDGLISCDEYQQPVLVRGVETNYPNISKLDSLVWNGTINFEYDCENNPNGIIGLNLAYKIGASVNLETPLSLYAPRNRKVNVARPEANFRQIDFYVSALFFVQQERYDNNLVILPIDAVRQVYEFDDNYINFIELRVSKIGAKTNYKEVERVKKELQKRLDDDYIVLNQHEQQADFYRISNIEKWTTFLILAFILMIATFNIISSLSMIIIEKKDDIHLFLSLGATPKEVRKLFITEGALIGCFGSFIGIVLGIIVVLLQEHFGLVKFSTGFMSQNYPVLLQAGDIIITLLAVLLLCIGSTLYTTLSGLKIVKYRSDEA